MELPINDQTTNPPAKRDPALRDNSQTNLNNQNSNIKKTNWSILIFLSLGILILVIAGVVVGKILSLNKAKNQPIELTYWGLWEPASVMQPLIDEYQTNNPRVKINYIFQSPREYRERLQNALSQGKGPDIFRIHNSWLPMFKSQLAATNFPEVDSLFYPVIGQDVKSGSSVLGVPLMIEGLGMYVNQDLLDQAGEAVPTTWEDLRRVAVTLSRCDTEDGKCVAGARILQSGVALGTADNVDHWQDVIMALMLQNNVSLNNPSGKPAEEVLEYYTLFSKSDHIWDSTLPNSTSAFASGQVAIYFAPSWRVHEIKATNPALNFQIYAIPQLPLDTTRGEQPKTWASYWMEGVNKKSLNATAAWDFLKFLSSQSSLQKLYTQAALSGRSFGEIYPRLDMLNLIEAAPYVGSYVTQAKFAQSWYLASNTFDGPTGINSRLNKYFTDAVNSVNEGRSSTEAVTTLSLGVNQVLSQYGLVAPLPATSR